MIPAARSFFFSTDRLPSAEQAALESRFFHGLRLPNGTYKTTYDDRMPDVDAALCAVLPRDRTVRVLDVGVSSGVTTLELVRAMEAHGIDAEVVAVDISVNAYLRRVAGVDLLCDPQGHVLQIALPFGVKGRPHDPGGSLARGLLQRGFEVAERLVGGATGARRGEPVQLVSPRLRERRDVRIEEHDLTRSRPEWVGGFDVVRAANVLNHDYFDAATLRTMVTHLATYLRPGGLLAVCRTHDDTRTNHATIFRRVEGGFEQVARIGNGSEIESLVPQGTP